MVFTGRILFCALILIKTVENAPQLLKHSNHDQSHISPEDKGLFEQYADLFEDFSGTDKETSVIVEDHLADLVKIAELCPRNEFFYNMNHEHLTAIAMLKSLFAETDSTRKFLKLAKAIRDREEIHPKVWYHALVSHSYENPELQRIRKYSPIEVMPDVFVNSFTLQKARDLEIERRKALNGTGTKAEQTCAIVDGTLGTDNGVENKLWYFREDLMLNSHHWVFHVIYPFRYEQKNRLDRFGELFYYMHHSVLARYNTERLGFWLEKTELLYPSKGGVIEEGYAPHLKDDICGKRWTNRVPFSKFLDIKFPGNDVFVDKMLVKPWEKIIEAIDRGYLDEGNGKKVLLRTTDGIDVISDIVQGTNNSINQPLYSGIGFWGLHNNGHLALGRNMDPTFEKKIPPGVMTETATAMRDPIFYRWHIFVNDLLDKYKRTLTPYMRTEGEHQLLWSGVLIRDLFVISDRTNPEIQQQQQPINELRTFWRTRKLRLTRGLDFFRPQGSVPAEICVKHLDHDEFTYHFVIERQESVKVSSATIRIFLAPREDLSSTQFTLEEQRNYFFVLDTFKTDLTIGLNNITRHSTQSSLTIPWSQSFEEAEIGNSTFWLSNSRNQYCGCGFPHHLLLPKSRPAGFLYDLFVMITNGEEDSVENIGKQSPIEFCQPAYLFCGLVGQKYPDAKPMGYPFDRLPYTSIITDSGDTKTIDTLNDYVEDISNMATVQVNIVQDVEPESVDWEEE